MQAARSSRLSLCGVRVDAVTLPNLIQVVADCITTREKLLILNHNLHSLYLYKSDSAFRAAYSQASMAYIDGLPVVWLGKAAGLPVNTEHRITFLDSFEAFLSKASDRRWRVFYLGSTDAVLTKALSILQARFPLLEISGRSGFFAKSGPESREVIAQINDYRADVLFVGMGMPVQEIWLSNYHSELRVPAVLTSGATLDYVIGEAYRPPAWAGPLGLYGVFRFFSDPRRLWRRYLIEPISVLRHLGLQIIQQRLREQAGASKAGQASGPA